MAETVGFAGSSCEVRKFGLRGLDLAFLQLGEPENPFLSFDFVRFDYSLSGLLKKHINRVIISGVEIRAEYKNGSFSIPGLDMEHLFKGYAETTPENLENRNGSYQYTLPVTIGQVEVRNAAIIVISDDTSFRIPFGIKARPFSESGTVPPAGYDLHMWLHPHVKDLIPGLKVDSRIDIHSVLDLTMHETGMRLNLADLNIEYDGYRIQNSPGNIPLTIDITKKRDAVHVAFSRFCILSPFPLEFFMEPDTDFHIRFTQEGMDVQGEIFVHFNKELLDNSFYEGLQLQDSRAYPLRLKGEMKGDDWQFSLHMPRTNMPLQFHGLEETFSFYPRMISVRGKGTASEAKVDFALRISDVTYNTDEYHTGIKDFRIHGNSSINSSQYPITKAFIQLADAEFKTESLYAGKIDAIVPFQWPISQEIVETEYRLEKKRYCTIHTIRYYDMYAGTISSVPYQDGMGFRLIGHYRGLLPDFTIDFTAKAGISKKGDFITEVDFTSSELRRAIRFDLGRFSDQLAGMFFDGNLGINGNYTLTGSTTTSSASLTIHNSRIDVPENNMTLAGINLYLTIKDLWDFRSAPDQVLRFKRFTWGDIEINEGEVEFEFDSSSLFLRKSSFSWCGGHVHTHGLQIKSGKSEMDIILMCDRLVLAQLLRQFNLAYAEGEGAVNGRIPIRYQDGKILIQDGFLYSTPGKGGTIRFYEKVLSPGALIAQQSIQIQIAQEALKNFNYDWARLSLQSQNEDLLILMVIDGRPAGLLPFGFRKDRGLYKTEGIPRANFQGIRFNINFRLPLDAILYYGTGLSEFFY